MAFITEVQRRRDEHELLKLEARTFGVEIDPGEGHEVLRERVEAVKAGDVRGYLVSTWEPVRAQKERVAEEAAKLAIVNGAPPWEIRDAIEAMMQKVERASPDLEKRLGEAIEQASAVCAEEIRRRQPSGVFSGSMPASTVIHIDGFKQFHERAQANRAQDLRTENRRIGEEIAKAPPEWAYPLAWRLAVMAVVESNNNRKDVTPLDTRYWEQKVAPSLRAYHHARLDGLLPEPAMMKAVRGDRDQVLDLAIVEKLYDGIACQAYERGRPGPGGVR